MKHFFTLIAAIFFTYSLPAQPNETARYGYYAQSKITISTLSNRQVRILVDGNNYNSQGNDHEISLADIRPGYHTIKVYQQKNNNKARSYNNMQLVYDAKVYVRPQYHIDIIINRFGKAFVDERQMNAEYYADNDNDYNNHGSNNNNYQPTMNNYSFEQFKRTLKNESFDNTRLVLARQTVAANYFSAAQVKEIVQLFFFENSKLEIAEYAYKYTTDKNNYFILNDAFAYSSSKEALARYIQASR